MTPEQQSQQLCDAIALGCQVHRGQLDLAGQPYILHVMRVVLACESEQVPAMVVAALHDVVEDGYSGNHLFGLKKIDFAFPPTVVDAVNALTRDYDESYDDYIARVAANRIARIVKQADLIDNLRDDRQPVGEARTATEARRAKYRRALTRLSLGIPPPAAVPWRLWQGNDG